jgi:small subunit ribosomal protein S17
MVRKIRQGKVVSDKMDKTVVVELETLRKHPQYNKVVRYRKRFKAHDEGNRAKEGNKVKIIETRPLSREKRWKVIEVIENDSDLHQP